MAPSQDIEDVKATYSQTQAQLIDSCEVRQEWVEWWRDVKTRVQSP